MRYGRTTNALMFRSEMSASHARHLRAKVLRINGSELEEELLPLLRENVFHVTTARAYWQIRRDGVIRSNQDGRFRFTYPQSGRSYGRQHGLVSLFDLRDKTDEAVRSTLDKFYFLRPGESLPVFLILSEAAYTRVIEPPPSMAAFEYKYIWIPESEAYYPGDLPLPEIASAIRPQIYHVPDPPEVVAAREAAMREAFDEIMRRRNERLTAERERKRAERIERQRATRRAKNAKAREAGQE